MKKTFTLIVVFCSLFISSIGQVLYDETFDYPYANLANEPSWTTAGTLTTGTGRNIVSTALTYSNSGGIYYHSGLGKTINTDISVSSTYSSLKPFTATPVGGTSTVYLTFMYKAGVTQSQSNSEVFGMASGNNAGAKVYVGKGAVTTTSYRFGTTRGSSTGADIKWGTTEFADVNAIILVVLKYDFATQKSSVYLNPTISGTEPAAPETFDNTTSTVRTSLNNLWFRATGSSVSKYNVSGARVSTTWAAAVAVQIPQLSSPVVGSASSISNTGFTANWTPVANATGYTVKVYSGATLVNTINASGQASASVAITGLISATTYTYTVTAVGDAINYTSSNPSAASLPFTTLGLVPPVVGVATSITAGGFTANWTTVANATGYDVKVYIGTYLVSTTNAPGQATESLEITGLSFGTSYTFVVIAKGDGITYLDSSPSAASPVFITLYVNVNTINTNFGDGTWGTPVPATPANGSFPSSSINGFIFEKAVIRVASKKDRRGNTHSNDITFDNVTFGGLVVFPVVNSVEQIELHAYTGTAERTFAVDEYNTGTSAWDLIGTYTYNQKSKDWAMDSIYVIPISRSVPTKFRVRNTGSGSFNVAQIITRLTNPATLPAPAVGVASNIISVGFTANWTTVDNATGYEVFVYKRGNFVSQTSASGQATASQAIVGLVSDSTYTFKVRANGDGFVNYADSYVSLASAPFTITFPATATWTGAVSSDWSLTGNWNPSTPGAITDVTIPGGLTNYPTVTTARSCHNLTIQSGAAGTGSIIGNNLLTIGGTATVEHYIPGAASAWHFLSSPVTSQAISPDFTVPTSTEYDFFAWYEQTEEWVNFKSTSGTTWTMANGSTSFVAGKGYLVQYLAANPTKIFTGILNTGTINFPMTISGIGTFAKSNLAGNPYPSSIDWKSATGWDKSNLATLGSGYDYHVWNDAASQYGVYNDQNSVDIGTHNVSRYIAPMQGFFVTAAVAGNLTMNDNARVHSSQSWLKSGSNEGLRLKVTAPENKGSDEILIDLGHSSSLGGAAKWYSFVPTAPSLSIPKSGTEYSISFMETITNETVIPVSFKAGIDGQYTINANLQELPNAQVYLLDNKLVKTQNLSENPVYTFTASKNDDASRFVLHFGNVFGVNETANPQPVNIYASNNSVYVAVTKTGLAKGEVYVYNTLGQVMAHQYLSGDLTKINLVASSGYYLVKVITAESTYTGKVFVKQQ